MAKNDNLKDFLTDVADAIREKKGTTDLINPQSFSDEIRAFDIGGGGNTPSRPKWTGHADADGLRAIGWTDEDIAYYQKNGVNWNEEDDQYHLVTDDNKNLYGVLTADNIRTYRDRIVYLPKIDISTKRDLTSLFYNCYALVAIPQLDTDVGFLLAEQMFKNCYSLVNIPPLDLNNVMNTSSMFSNCYSLVSIPQLNTANVTSMSSMFSNCYSLTYANLKNITLAYRLNNSVLLSKESLLYLINNEAATSAITITLAPYAYTRLAEDVDIVAALANHPNVSISK